MALSKQMASRHPKASRLQAAVRFLLRSRRPLLKAASWSLSSSDSDIMRLELCSVLRCLTPADQKMALCTGCCDVIVQTEDGRLTEPGAELQSLLLIHVV